MKEVIVHTTDDSEDNRHLPPYPKGHTVSVYRYSMQNGVLPSYRAVEIVMWLNCSGTMQLIVHVCRYTWVVVAGCYRQVAVSYIDHHACTCSTVFYQTQI